jgi:tetratricopeptide (TPR) repeat protein
MTALQAQKPDEAISLFSRALQQNPKDAAARAGLGLAYEAKGWLAEATTQFEQAAKAAEETATQARFNLGLIAFKQNKFEEALGHFNSVLSKNSTHSEAKRYAELTVQQLHHALGRPDPNLGRKKSD